MHTSLVRTDIARAVHGDVREVSATRVEAVELVVTADCFLVKVSRGVAEVEVEQAITAQKRPRREGFLIDDWS